MTTKAQVKSTRVLTLTSYVEGMPTKEHFQLVTLPIDKVQKDQLLLETIYVSVDPYMRIKMSGVKNFTDCYEIGKPIYSTTVSLVLVSKSDKFSEGDHVIGELNCADFNVVDADQVTKVDKRVPLDHAMSLFGMTGMTSYAGFVELAQPKAGETVLISAGAGATGNKVAQLAKIHGCKVYCLVGDDKKRQFLNDLGIEFVINYRLVGDLDNALKELIPQKIDIFFDNVGGTQFDIAIQHMKEHGRVISCGAISTYNAKGPVMGPRIEQTVIFNRLKIQGFNVNDYQDRFPEFTENLLNWYQEGKLKDKFTVYKGLENVMHAFIDLFEGKNVGKMLVQIPT